ncbi:hypothetical protein D3C80_1376070 [compost metagenome]
MRIAARAGIGADIEIRQAAVEQVRDQRADGMGIPQQCVAELRLHPRQLVGQGAVIGRPHFGQVTRPLLFRRRHALAEQRTAVEQGFRVQAGGGGGVQRLVVGRPIEIDHIARVLRGQHAGAEFVGHVVETRDVPVGVGQLQRLVHQTGLDRRGQANAGVRHADQQRHAAAAEAQDVIHR